MSDDPEQIVVELVRARRGRLELLGEHARRLAAALERPATDAATIEAFARAGWAERGGADGVLMIEGAPQGLRIRDAAAASADVAELIEGETLAAGFAVVTATAPSAPAQSRKTLARLIASAGRRRDANARGADELLGRGPDGAIVGATGANLFLVIAGELVTPSLESGAFAGITRRATLLAARDLGVVAREAVVATADVARADDAFLTSSALGLVSIRSIDGRPLAAPARGTSGRALVPKLRLRLHELSSASELPH